MTAHDISIFLIYQVPGLAFLFVGVMTLLLPVVHLLLAFGRVLSGRPASINWWVVGRALPFVLAVIVLIPFMALARQWTREDQLALAEVALIYLSCAMIMLPIAMPLIQAYVQRLPRMGTFVYSVIALLALPVAAALATEASIITTNSVALPQDYPEGRLNAFTVANQISSCQLAIFRVVPEGMVMDLPPAEAPIVEAYQTYFFFWADMTIKAVFLDFFEVFDCGITTVRHNPDHVMTSSLIFIYRSFVSLIVVAVLALPFARTRDE